MSAERQLTDPLNDWRGMHCCDCLAPLYKSNIYEAVEDFDFPLDPDATGAVFVKLICKPCAAKRERADG